MEENTILYFDNDDDFSVFALEPMSVCSYINPDGEEVFCMQHKFTQKYYDAINSGKLFCIRDLKSHVNKDGLLGTQWATYRIPQENIELYFGEE